MTDTKLWKSMSDEEKAAILLHQDKHGVNSIQIYEEWEDDEWDWYDCADLEKFQDVAYRISPPCETIEFENYGFKVKCVTRDGQLISSHVSLIGDQND